MDQQACPSNDPQTYLRSPAHGSAPGRQAASTAAAGLLLRLSTAAERLAHHRRTRVVHGEATPSRLTALAVLEAAGPLRISDLAARTAIGLPAMSRIVERLSQYSWAARHPDPTDHRACLVSITKAGTELLDAMRRCWRPCPHWNHWQTASPRRHRRSSGGVLDRTVG